MQINLNCISQVQGLSDELVWDTLACSMRKCDRANVLLLALPLEYVPDAQITKASYFKETRLRQITRLESNSH